MSELAQLCAKHDAKKTPELLAAYEARLAPLRAAPLKLLELGTYEGGSVRMWLDWFPNATVTGLDLRPVPVSGYGDRVRLYAGAQQDRALLDRIAAETAPEGFDVVIDDASHFALLTKVAFWHLFEHHLKPGGLYVIEDWGTGFWDDWADGGRYQFYPEEPLSDGRLPRIFHSHNFGMVGFVKQLVDECHSDAVKPRQADPPNRPSRFAGMTIQAGVVFVEKARPRT